MSAANFSRAALCALFAVALVNLPSHARVSPVTKKAGQLEVELREEVHQIPIAGAGATENIVVSSFRPRDAEPFPWIVISHGTALTGMALT